MTSNELNRHFSKKDKWPNFLDSQSSIASDSNHFEIDCHIQSDLSWFKGHFPEQAVLPGVVQVNWANDLAAKLFNTSEFRAVNSLKFNTMILPEATVTLVLAFNPEKQTVKFSYKTNDVLFSSGVLVFDSVSY